MTLTPMTFLIVCPFLFLAGLIDSIAGGGGLISLPVYLIAGLPVHNAIATNKLSSSCGTTITTIRFIKNGLVNFTIAIPSIIAAIIGSTIGANLSLIIDERILKWMMIIVLPVAAFVVFNKNLFKDNASGKAETTKRTLIVAAIAAFIVGMYDGLYGPGTGTFLIIAFTVFAKMSIASANAQAKVINLTTNLTALTIFLINGKAIIPLGLAAAACNMLGNYVGSGLVMDKGSKIVKPVILLVLAMLFVKIITELI